MESCNDDRLKEKAEAAFTELKAHYEAGKKVTKDLWPRYYATKWGITNLYVKRLGSNLRLTYTLVSGAAGIEVFCLEILSHSEYDKRFGYHTS